MVTDTAVEPCGALVCPGFVSPGFVLVDDEVASDPTGFVSSLGLTILQPLNAVTAARESAANVIPALNFFIRSPPTRTDRASLPQFVCSSAKNCRKILYTIFMHSASAYVNFVIWRSYTRYRSRHRPHTVQFVQRRELSGAPLDVTPFVGLAELQHARLHFR